MEKYKYKRIIMIIYLIVLIIMLIFFVPFNISITYMINNVPHSFIQKTEFHSIVYNYYKGTTQNTAITRSIIDYSRLFTQIFLLSLIFGGPYLLTSENNNIEDK